MNIRENVGKLDTTIRCLLSVVMLIVVTEGMVAGTLAVALGFVATIFMLTASFGYCPLYKLLGINTWGSKVHYLVEH